MKIRNSLNGRALLLGMTVVLALACDPNTVLVSDAGRDTASEPDTRAPSDAGADAARPANAADAADVDAGDAKAGDAGDAKAADAAQATCPADGGGPYVPLSFESCEDLPWLHLSHLVLAGPATPGATVTLHVDLTDVCPGFVNYPGVVLECDELGALVSKVDSLGSFLYVVTASDTKTLVLSVSVSPTAPSGSTVHCTAHAAKAQAHDCANAERLSIAFQVQ